jgi:hypothetical protein
LSQLAERHDRELGECQMCYDTATKDIADIQKTLTEFSENLQCWHVELSSNFESIPDRVACVEQQQRDSTQHFAKDLQVLQQRLEACRRLLHCELSNSQNRNRLIATELQRDAYSKTDLVNKLTRSASRPSSMSTASTKTSPIGQDSPLSPTRQGSPLSSLSVSPRQALRNAVRYTGKELAHPPLSELPSPETSWLAQRGSDHFPQVIFMDR